MYNRRGRGFWGRGRNHDKMQFLGKWPPKLYAAEFLFNLYCA